MLYDDMTYKSITINYSFGNCYRSTRYEIRKYSLVKNANNFMVKISVVITIINLIIILSIQFRDPNFNFDGLQKGRNNIIQF